MEWCTHSENAKHAIRTGLNKMPGLKGEDHSQSKLKESDIVDILKMGLICQIPAIKIHRLYPDVHSSLINYILKGKVWNDKYEEFKKVFLL